MELWSGNLEDGLVPLAVGSDTTAGLVTSGVVELLLPQRLAALTPADLGTGADKTPPPLADDKQAAAVVAWLSASRPQADHLNDVIGRVRALGRPERGPDHPVPGSDPRAARHRNR